MDALLQAILDDNRATVENLLTADSLLVAGRVSEARYYDHKIFHWLYVGDTALHLAAAGYRVEIVRLLLASGSDPNASMNMRHSGPLHYAADGYINGPVWDPEQQVQTIECLLAAGAKVNAQDKNGATALHRAVRTRCAAAARVLLQAGGDPRMRNKPGSTAFHLAVQNTGRGGSGTDKARAAQREIIEEFLRFGVNPAIKDCNGKSVLDWVKSDWIREMFSGKAP
jgi:Ankyrin repeats (many copies)/Ankyrin repeats (3 copies)